MINNIIKTLPVIFIAIISISCTSIQSNNQYYRDQNMLYCKHDPEYDGKNFKIYKYALYILKEDKTKEISIAMAETIKGSGKNFLNITPYETLKKRIVARGLNRRTDRITSAYQKTGIFPEKDLQALGNDLKYDFLMTCSPFFVPADEGKPQTILLINS